MCAFCDFLSQTLWPSWSVYMYKIVLGLTLGSHVIFLTDITFTDLFDSVQLCHQVSLAIDQSVMIVMVCC